MPFVSVNEVGHSTLFPGRPRLFEVSGRLANQHLVSVLEVDGGRQAAGLQVGPEDLLRHREAVRTEAAHSFPQLEGDLHQLSSGLRQEALALIRSRYEDFGPTFAHEKLTELHGLAFSVETLRHWMIDDGLWISRAHREPRIQQPRRRRSCRGELIQIDGSDHEWFEDRAARCTLLVFVDDATSELMELLFCESESAFSYFAALRAYLAQHGKPVALSDKVYREQAEVRVVDADRYGRTVGHIWIGDRHINREMVREGHAWVYRKYLDDKTLLDDETHAQKNKVGLWGLGETQRVPPWDWRRGKRLTGPEPKHLPNQTFSCSTKRKCGEMASCAEARFYLEECGLTRLDGDGDGVPCEVLCR